MVWRRVHGDAPNSTALLAAAVGVLMVTCGCGNEADIRPGDVRTYRTPGVATPRTVASRDVPPEPSKSAVRYDVPEGWSDGGASGLRLATLVIGDPAEKNEVTVIPASGSLEGNVARWVGQLDESSNDDDRQAAAAAAIAAGQPVDVDGVSATVVLLLDAAASGGDDTGAAILGAMIPVDESAALFVKYKGSAAIARRERENFVRFVSSLRWK